MGFLSGIQNSVDQATKGIKNGDLAAVGDAAAGNIDESIGRQFDDKKGGGFADEAANIVGDVSPVDIDKTLDNAAGKVDEAVGRQFDDEKGGGIVDQDTINEQTQKVQDMINPMPDLPNIDFPEPNLPDFNTTNTGNNGGNGGNLIPDPFKGFRNMIGQVNTTLKIGAVAGLGYLAIKTLGDKK